MDGLSMTAETPSASSGSVSESAPGQVFQPPKLREIVEVIDLMGTVASRVREDSSGDLGGGGSGGAGQAQTGGATGTSARDDAIKNAPAPAIMQQKLITHLSAEIKRVEQQARTLMRSNQRGSAFLLAELYRKIRRLTALIADILSASADMIKRFYVSVFIDRQPMVVTGGSLAASDTASR